MKNLDFQIIWPYLSGLMFEWDGRFNLLSLVSKATTTRPIWIHWSPRKASYLQTWRLLLINFITNPYLLGSLTLLFKLRCEFLWSDQFLDDTGAKTDILNKTIGGNSKIIDQSESWIFLEMLVGTNRRDSLIYKFFSVCKSNVRFARNSSLNYRNSQISTYSYLFIAF